jgi:xanthine/CO dehydrogenase XdhC/CoxF family maturation factor
MHLYVCVKHTCIGNVVAKPACGIVCGPTIALFAWLISHQPAVLFSQNKPATSNQTAVLFSQNKPAPAISHQPNKQAECHAEGYLPAKSRSKIWKQYKAQNV